MLFQGRLSNMQRACWMLRVQSVRITIHLLAKEWK